MRTVTYKLEDLKTKVIHIGKVAENDATRVQIDAGSVFAEHPAAVPAMSMINPEGTAFPVSVERSGDMVLWDVKDSALAAEGQGEIQFTFTEGNTVAKSVIGRVQICRSIVGDGEAPDPIQDWMTEADAALEEIEGISATAETLSAGSQATASYDSGVLTFGIPQGAQGAPGQDGQDGADGQDGVSPTVAVTTITGGHTVTITDAQGDHAFNVMDGTAGAVIDDTSTAADKVWSASKTNDLKSAIQQLPTDETGESLLQAEESKTALLESALNLIDENLESANNELNSAPTNTTGEQLLALEEERTNLTNKFLKIIDSKFDGDAVGDDYIRSFIKTKIRLKPIGVLERKQSFCMYDGKFYCADHSNHITEQNPDFSHSADYNISTGHGNAFQLGSGDIAYISGWEDQKIYTVDMSTMTEGTAITLPTTGYTTCVVDDVNNIAYILQRDTPTGTETNYNFIKYNLTGGSVISTRKLTMQMAAVQGMDFYDDKIYVLNGLGTAVAPNGYRVFDTDGNLLYEYVFGSMSEEEPEGIFVDRTTRDIYISFFSGYIYKLIVM